MTSFSGEKVTVAATVAVKGAVAGCIWAAHLVVTGVTQVSIADELEPALEMVSETLMSTQLEGVDGTEVVVNRVVMPKNSTLPKHWHPGEEFAYVLEGATILRREGKADLTVSKGELIKIPLREIHSAVATDQGATILVFRVHEQGQPERTLVD